MISFCLEINFFIKIFHWKMFKLFWANSTKLRFTWKPKVHCDTHHDYLKQVMVLKLVQRLSIYSPIWTSLCSIYQTPRLPRDLLGSLVLATLGVLSSHLHYILCRWRWTRFLTPGVLNRPCNVLKLTFLILLI